MNIAAAVVLAFVLALPAAAAPPAKKFLPEASDLIVSFVVEGPSGRLTSKSRAQAQSQFNSIRTTAKLAWNISCAPPGATTP
jgi:hypothetical protein